MLRIALMVIIALKTGVELVLTTLNSVQLLL